MAHTERRQGFAVKRGVASPRLVRMLGADARMSSNDEPEPATTGWPPAELMQDDCRELSKWLASKPDARLHAREAAAAIEKERLANDRGPVTQPVELYDESALAAFDLQRGGAGKGERWHERNDAAAAEAQLVDFRAQGLL